MKKQMLTAVIALTLLGAGCTSSTQLPTEDANTSAADITGVTFDGKEIAVGDTVRGMKLEQASGTCNEYRSQCGFTFSGEVELTGTYAFGSGETGFPGDALDDICFSDLDQASLAKLPHIDQDTPNTGFCFSNAKDFVTQFEQKSGRATVVIGEYSNGLSDKDTTDVAHLLRIVNQ